MENEVVDTANEIQADISTETPPTKESNEAAQHTPAETSDKRYAVKINGEEMQLTEPELIKYAQLGKAGQRAMEKAASLEKKQKELYGQLVQAAESDPYALYEVLTGKKHPHASTAQQPQAQGQELDPRDQKIKEYESKLAKIEQRLEQEDIAKEREAVESELTEAVKKYPVLDSPYLKHFVKAEYRKALINGLDYTLEDVAFHVAQDYKAQEAQRVKATQQKLEENKKRAPVITAPGVKGDGKKPMTLDDVKRLAGRAV
jgi:hypothetical protein